MSKIGRITLIQIANLGVIRYAIIKMTKGKIHRVVGPNGSGKSTLLNAIKFAFEGKTNIPNDIIRHGEYIDGAKIGTPIDRANIRMETSEGYVVQRIIRKNANGDQVASLEVTKNNKAVPGGPQEFVNALLSNYRDPQKIANMKSKDLFDMLTKNIDLSGLNKKLEQIKIDQTVQRKYIKDLGVVKIPDSIEPDPETVIDIQELGKNLQIIKNEATVIQSSITTDKDNLVYKYDPEITRLKNVIAKSQDMLTAAIDEKSLAEKRIKENELLILDKNDTIAAKQKAFDSADINSEISLEWKRYNEHILNKTAREKELADLKEDENETLLKIRNMVSEAEFPMDVKCTPEKEVYMGNILWDNVETSKRMTEGIKYCVSQIPKDGLRLLTIERGESIGTKLLKEIETCLDKNDADLIMEVFSETGDANASILLEEGEIMGMGDEPDVTSDSEPDLPEPSAEAESLPESSEPEPKTPDPVYTAEMDLF